MEKKEDRRIAMTKRLLKAALIELLKEQDIYHISIRELCERADVNRTTFYKYYGSQFDLLTDMEKDMLDFIAKAIERHETEPEKIITAACRYLEENLEFARLIINNNVDPAFAHKLFAMDSLKESARKMLSGSNSHHMIEGMFKAFAKALDMATTHDPRITDVLSTKGSL